jgi:hypothetical protein
MNNKKKTSSNLLAIHVESERIPTIMIRCTWREWRWACVFAVVAVVIP